MPHWLTHILVWIACLLAVHLCVTPFLYGFFAASGPWSQAVSLTGVGIGVWIAWRILQFYEEWREKHVDQRA